MIEIKDLSFRYKDSKNFALEHISLEINQGEFVGIVGNNGAGKSSLCFALSGVIPHYYNGDYYGQVIVQGMDTIEHGPEEMGSVLACVFQDIDGQMVSTMVEDEILFGLENFAIPKEEIEARLQETLKSIGILELRHRSLSSLSGGQKQKVAIAAAIALHPRILILDEPTGELDPYSSEQIYRLLQSLRERYGMTIIVVEQKKSLLTAYADRILVLHQGVLRMDDSVESFLARKSLWEETNMKRGAYLQLADALKNNRAYGGQMPRNVEDSVRMLKEVYDSASL